MIVSILTPTYNRGEQLKHLYNALKRQTRDNFEWIIIDDGSNDKTKEYVQEFIEENIILIKYEYKSNGGKHTALNKGIRLAEGELTFIVDSDDILTEDAIEEVILNWDKVKHMNLCGMSFLRGYTKKQVIGDKHTEDFCIDDFINMRFNKHVKGDKAEVWVTEKLKEVPFPEIEGERFFGENYVWVNLAKKYKMLFINRIIYITEYLEGGLTKSGRTLRIRCPEGGMINAKEILGKEFSIKYRLKNIFLYICYGLFAKKSLVDMFKDSGSLILTLIGIVPGYMIYKYWKFKYMDSEDIEC